MNEQRLPVVEDWTIEPVDTVVYELFLRGRGSLPGAAAECELSETEFSRRVDRLLARKLLRPLPGGGPQGIEAVPPQHASADITNSFRRRAQCLSREIHVIRSEFSALETLYLNVSREASRANGHEISLDGGDLLGRLNELCLHAQDQLLLMHPAIAPHDLVQTLSRVGNRLQEWGIGCRAVFREALLRQAKVVDDVRLLTQMGVDVRTVAVTPVSVILMDRETAIVPLDSGNGPQELFLREPRVASFAQQVFEHVWESATPFTETTAGRPDFDNLEMAILSALGAGHTDEATARQLGISTRTLRRYLAGLSERLGTETRFQLGCAAARAGLLGQDGDRWPEQWAAS
jgi:DNA-binding CsgD family transcriptional regulator